MPTVEYPHAEPYLHIGAALSPALSVTLIHNAQRALAVAVFDSGSTVTIFNPEHALLLGIDDVSLGDPASVGTQAGPVRYYLFDLEMEIVLGSHSSRFPCRIGFFEVKKPRNILGRNFVFQYYQIGFHDSHELLYLRPENQL